jgi:uncharacterized protein (TIGR02270 family)
VEERLLAHADGLVLGGREVMERLLLPALADDSLDPEVTWAAAFALLEGGLEGSVEAVLEAMGKSGEMPERLAALGRAAELTSAAVEGPLRPLLQSERPEVAAVALRALAARGAPVGDRLDDFIASANEALSAAALEEAWRDPSLHRRELVERAFSSGSPKVRDAALRAGLCLRLRPAWDVCVRVAAKKEPSPGFAFAALALLGGAGDLEAVEGALGEESLRADALFALGFSGRVRAVEACLPWLADQKAGGAAGEVFSAITGVEIAGGLEGVREDEGEGEEDPGEEVPTAPEAELPIPDAEQVQASWAKHRPKLRPELRTLGGEPVTAARLRSALRDGPMRRRPLLALELAVRTQAPLLDTGRWARRQLADAAPPARNFEDGPFETFAER